MGLIGTRHGIVPYQVIGRLMLLLSRFPTGTTRCREMVEFMAEVAGLPQRRAHIKMMRLEVTVRAVLTRLRAGGRACFLAIPVSKSATGEASRADRMVGGGGGTAEETASVSLEACKASWKVRSGLHRRSERSFSSRRPYTKTSRVRVSVAAPRLHRLARCRKAATKLSTDSPGF